MATEAEVAWAAGLFEGEGTFTISHSRTRNCRSVQARCASTDRDVLVRLQRIVGMGTIYDCTTDKHRERNWKPCFQWSVSTAPKVIATIDLFRPWLGERRSRRAQEVYEAALSLQPANKMKTHCKRGHPFSGANLRQYSYGRYCIECQRIRQRKVKVT